MERSNPGPDDRDVLVSAPDAAGLPEWHAGETERPARSVLEPSGTQLFDPRLNETEFDSIEEVDAVARSLRRVAIQYGSAILIVLLLVPVLSLVAPLWFARPILGGLTLNFLFVAVVLHVVFLVGALIFNRVATRSEDEMLGRLEDGGDWEIV